VLVPVVRSSLAPWFLLAGDVADREDDGDGRGSTAGPRAVMRGSPEDHQRITRLRRPRAGRTIDAMDHARTDLARTALLEERARMLAELGAELDAPEQMTYGSQAAAASQVFAQQRDLALREAAERRVREVDGALARIDAGAFGRCTACGGPIAEARLDALPWAALCIDCQRRTVSR
jgi:DnaK suppressor protein